MANSGDARCVLGASDGTVVRMSIDHTPQERSEAEVSCELLVLV